MIKISFVVGKKNTCCWKNKEGESDKLLIISIIYIPYSRNYTEDITTFRTFAWKTGGLILVFPESKMNQIFIFYFNSPSSENQRELDIMLIVAIYNLNTFRFWKSSAAFQLQRTSCRKLP